MVTQLPLHELWDEQGRVSSGPVGDLGRADIQALLVSGPLHFVVADVGHPLRWVPLAERFHFWKSEGRPHLLEPMTRRPLDELPGGHAYFATQWQAEGAVIVVLSKTH